MPEKKKQQTGLGKGLGALIPSIKFTDKGFEFSDDEHPSSNFAIIDIDKIELNPYQPRKDFDEQALEDLKNSILEHGVIQPITVRRSVKGYELISGERRLKACILAKISKIPAYILDIEHGISMLEIALIENLQREDLNPIETASGYQRLIEECNLTQDQVAKKIGKDRSTVANFLRLLRLPEKVQESLRKQEITMGHARALLSLENDELIIKAWNYILQSQLSVRATENLVKDILLGNFKFSEQEAPSPAKTITPRKKDQISKETITILSEKEHILMQLLGTKVKISPKSETSGTIEIEFYSIEDFERLMEIFHSINEKKK